MKIQMEITIPKFLFTSEDFKQKKNISGINLSGWY